MPSRNTRASQASLSVHVCPDCNRIRTTLDLQPTAAIWIEDPDDPSKSFLVARSFDAAITLAVRERSVQEVTTLARRVTMTPLATQIARAHRKRKADAVDDVSLVQSFVQNDVNEESGGADVDMDGEKSEAGHGRDENDEEGDQQSLGQVVEEASEEEGEGEAQGLVHKATSVNAKRENAKRHKRNKGLSTILDDLRTRFRAMQSTPESIRSFDELWTRVRSFTLDQDLTGLKDADFKLLEQVFEAVWNIGGAALFIEWKKLLGYWRASCREPNSDPIFPVLPRREWWEMRVSTPNTQSQPRHSSLPPSAQQSRIEDSQTGSQVDKCTAQHSTLDQTRKKLRAAYEAVTASSAVSQLQEIVYRDALADVYAHYIDIQNQLADPGFLCGENGKSMKKTKQTASASKTELFRATHPNMDLPSNRDENSLAGKAWRSLGRIIDQGKRWYTLREEWGPCALILWPSQSMSHSTFERLPMPLFTLLLRLVLNFRVDRLEFAGRFTDIFHQIVMQQKPPTTLSNIEWLTEDEITKFSMAESPSSSWLMQERTERVKEVREEGLFVES
jgi:hypothetical protein